MEDFGAVADDAIDDSKAVQAALEKARGLEEPVTIAFGPGRFMLSEVFKINRGDLVIAGSGQGAGGTELHFPRPLALIGDGGKLDELRTYLRENDKRQVEKTQNLDIYFSEYSWSGGFFWVGRDDARPSSYLPQLDRKDRALAHIARGQRGGLSLTLKKPSRLVVGDTIEVQWYNEQGPDAAIIDAIYGETDLDIGSHHWTFNRRPLARQQTRVVAVDGLNVTLASPLMHDIRADLPAQISEWAPLERVGIQDLRFTFPQAAVFGHHVEQGYNAIYLTGVGDGWIENVTITDADSGILTYDSANVTIRNIRTDGTRRAHYSVHLGNVHQFLVDRVRVMNPVVHAVTFNTQSTKSVFKDVEVFVDPVLDQHAGANHQNLFDRITFHLSARRDGDKAFFPVWDGSGAPYWQPGHGAFNTTWNLKLLFEGGAAPGETVEVRGLAEGPSARIVGTHGNRPLTLDYRPAPYVEMLNEEILAAPSLYDYQLAKRLPK